MKIVQFDQRIQNTRPNFFLDKQRLGNEANFMLGPLKDISTGGFNRKKSIPFRMHLFLYYFYLKYDENFKSENGFFEN